MVRFLESILHGYSQVFLQKNAIMGALIMVGLAMASPVALVMSLLGALASLGVGLFLHAPRNILESGLYCFNGVLVGAAATVFIKQVPTTIIVTVVASIVAALVFHLFTKNHLTALSAPFVLVVWAVILTAKYLNK